MWCRRFHFHDFLDGLRVTQKWFDSLQGFLMFWNTWRLGRYWEWWWVPNSTVLMESTTAKHHKCLVTSGRSCCSYEEVHFFHQYHTNILLKIAVFQLSQLVRQIGPPMIQHQGIFIDDIWEWRDFRHLALNFCHCFPPLTGTDRCLSERHRDREVSRIFRFRRWIG